ncbi:ADP-glyceromanno-heptose 6-epimerase [Candidatus Giovannonibacteria bacterium RIFCSPLOWO2_01_FULL_46_13]|uniref:ADP-glyceromanno-heptose 6-epimerase n=1 Tax=Candidatus Giovannonibacteria bacterium RIFCSPLOWO2_01_FULL_46_13 TaxID=1798352 RepID=A0A1F5X424_9BACT|nr:MAG: ADP-glyceromanno-heptose 6-epimerase [Candidatus Giovannonibacteria bacterium RIFCSPLOWO2_01_FULL_46_13]
MIVVTGAAGFIGSVLARALKDAGHNDLVLVDDAERNPQCLDLWKLEEWLKENSKKVDFVFHIGGNSSTVVFDKSVFDKYNVDYSKMVWNFCTENKVPLIYASSAATYGDGSGGYSDDHVSIASLKPLNPYGQYKHDFDLWALSQTKTPPSWAGLKFFNVYGPNEYHKGRMASVVLHSFNQIKEHGKVKLFKYGEQKRDFVYAKDIAEVCIFLMKNKPSSGIYNVGTGQARTFKELAEAVFTALDKKPEIEYVDIPEDIKDKYQSFTEAKIGKLRLAGYSKPFTPLEDGVKDYVLNHLLPKKHF